VVIEEWIALTVYYNVCPNCVFTELSFKLFNTYIRAKGFKYEPYESYLRLPSIFEKAIEIIDIEQNKQTKIKSKSKK